MPTQQLNETREANLIFSYSQKSREELQNAWFVFKLLSNPLIVAASSQLTLLALKLHLPVGFVIKRTLFKHFCGGETLEESDAAIAKLGESGIGTTLDYSVESTDSEVFFDRTLAEILKAIDHIRDNPWVNNLAIKPTGLISVKLLEKTSKGLVLSRQEQSRFTFAVGRIDQICKAGSEAGIEVYIDAEGSDAQDAIDEVSMAMMRKYNSESPVAFITLQMYRTDRLEYLQKILAKSRDEGFKPGVKLVRGAYWDRENAKGKNIVYAQKKDTDDAYNKALDLCIDNLDHAAVCNATHNEESSMHLVNIMRARGIPACDKRIHFSQLYGMSDHISYSLAKAGYNVTKYLPYGKVKQVIPYLIRRARENSSIKGQMGRELRMIEEARKRSAE